MGKLTQNAQRFIAVEFDSACLEHCSTMVGQSTGILRRKNALPKHAYALPLMINAGGTLDRKFDGTFEGKH